MSHEMAEEYTERSWPLRMGSQTDMDVLLDAHPEHTVSEGSAASNQRFATNTHPEGLDDGVDQHGSKVSGPTPG